MATIFIRTLIIYFLLIIAMRMMGKRQIGQLEITDLVSTLLLSEIATLPIENQDIPVIYAIIPIIIIMTAEIVSAALPTKFPKLKNLFSTRPETLVKMGAPDLNALKAARMTADELMVALRKNGISDIDEVGYAILEQDGSVSVLPRAEQRPATAADVGKSPQESIDLLNQALIRNAVMAATPRYFVRSDGAVNEAEFADWRKPFVHVSGNLGDDSLKQIRMAPIDGAELQILNNKIEELKFTCGNTDVQAGASLSGVTAASAIAALQEAAGRTSRDMSQSAYRAYARMITLVIERIRQFYDWPRQFRILGPMGQESYVAFTNERMRPVSAGGSLMRKPVFDVKVSAQRKTSYSRISQNELAIQMMGLGVFDPARAEQALMLLDMMDFDGREELMGKISANAGLQDKLQMYQQMAVALADQHEPQMAPGLQAAARRDRFPAQSVKKPAAPPHEEHPFVERSRQQAEEAAMPQH